MPLIEHLREFRTRLVRAAAAVLIGTLVGYALFPQAVDLLLRPYCTAIGAIGSCDLIVLGPLDPFIVRLRTAFVAGDLDATLQQRLHGGLGVAIDEDRLGHGVGNLHRQLGVVEMAVLDDGGSAGSVDVAQYVPHAERRRVRHGGRVGEDV